MVEIEQEGRVEWKVAFNATPKSGSKPIDKRLHCLWEENSMTPDDFSNTLSVDRKNPGKNI